MLLHWLPRRAPEAVDGADGHDARIDLAAGERVPVDEQRLTERLNGIDGFDLTSGLRNVGGSLPVLADLLRQFVRMYPNGAPGLASTDTPEDRAQCRKLCHSLRGACATVGARRLSEDLGAFEKALVAQAEAVLLHQRGEALQGRFVSLVTELTTELA
jgi:two-component system, sensor histidine kinase and response regulator